MQQNETTNKERSENESTENKMDNIPSLYSSPVQ